MQKKWKNCKKILCIRLDNMGDIIMSTPAIHAIKETFNCHITLLTSSMGNPITAFIPCVDDVIIYNPPWVKSEKINSGADFNLIISEIIKMDFDGAIIFNVYSQNPMPVIMLAYLAGIPLRLAYCRENPYYLLTDWVVDKEPYSFILHQVKRDLALVKTIGAKTENDNLILKTDDNNWPALANKLSGFGIDINKKWIVAHAGVSERKRFYPKENWIELAKQIIKNNNCQILFTGSASEAGLTEYLANQIGENAFAVSGKLSMGEFLLLIKNAPLIISVNTVAIHIAAALNTPIIVLYALTNPQHLPWKAKGFVFPYQVPKALQSKNEIIKYVTENLHPDVPKMQPPDTIIKAASAMLELNNLEKIPEMFALKSIQ